MANYLARGLPSLINTPVLGILRTCSYRFPSSNDLSLGGNGCGLRTALLGCRFKSGGQLNLGKSSRKRAGNLELYQSLQIGSSFKKVKSKPKKHAFPQPVSNTKKIKVKKPSLTTSTSPLTTNTTTKITGSFLSTLGNKAGCAKAYNKQNCPSSATCLKNKILGTDRGRSATSIFGEKAQALKNRDQLFNNVLAGPSSTTTYYKRDSKSNSQKSDTIMDNDMYFQSEYLQSCGMLNTKNTKGLTVETLDLNVPAMDKRIPAEAYWMNNGFKVKQPTPQSSSSSPRKIGANVNSLKHENSKAADSVRMESRVVKEDNYFTTKKSSADQSRQEYEHLLYNEKRHQQKNCGSRDVTGRKKDSAILNFKKKMKQISLKEREKTEVAKQSSSMPSNEYVFVDEVSEKNYKMSSKKGSTSLFSTEIDALIQALKLDDGWETAVQKSLSGTRKKSKSTSFILVDDKRGAVVNSPVSDQQVFPDPVNPFGNYNVFGKNIPLPRAKTLSQNVSTVPNNTSKMTSQIKIGELKPNLSKKNPAIAKQTDKIGKTTRETAPSKSEPVLSVQPNEIKNRATGSSKQKVASNKAIIKSSSSFHNLSKELLSAIDKSRLDDSSMKRGKDIWPSSKLLEMKKAKRNKQDKKLKDASTTSRSIGQNSNDVSVKQSATTHIKPSMSTTAAEKERKHKDVLREQLKQEFRQGFLQMQRERLAKSRKSSLVHTPNSFAQWMKDTKGKGSHTINKKSDGDKSSTEFQNISQNQTGRNNENEKLNCHNDNNIVRLMMSDVRKDLTAEQELMVRNITANIRESLHQLRDFNSKIKNMKKEIGENSGMSQAASNSKRGAYYVLADEPFEKFAKRKDEQYFNEMLKSNGLSTLSTKNSFPVLGMNKLDGFMTMTLTRVEESPMQQKTGKLTRQEQQLSPALSKEADKLLATQQLARNMEALRRYQERQEKGKEDKRKRKKKHVKRNNSDNGERTQRTSVRKSKTS